VMEAPLTPTSAAFMLPIEMASQQRLGARSFCKNI
jgi:hypothetical protein